MRRIFLVFILLIVISLFMGCTDSTNSTLTITNIHAVSPELDKYIKYYKMKNPHVTINVVECNEEDVSGENLLKNLLNMKTKTDILLLSSANSYHYIKSGILQDLSKNKTIDNAMNNKDLMDGLKALYINSQGSYFSIPIKINYVGLIPNVNLFKKLNLKLPDEDWSFDEYYSIAKQSRQDTSGDGIPDTYLMFSPRQKFMFINPALGIDYYNDFKVHFNTENFIGYMKKGKEIFDAGAFYFPNHIEFETEEDFLNAQWNDNCLFYTISELDIDFYQNSKYKNCTILPPPKTYIDGISLPSTMMCLSKEAENSDLAIDFMNGFLSEDYQREYTNSMQLYKDISKYKLMKDYSKKIENWFEYNTRYGRTTILITEFWAWMNDELYLKLSSGDISLEECAKQMQYEAEYHLGKSK